MQLIRRTFPLAAVILAAACGAQVTGDFDGDGDVTTDDLAFFTRAWTLSHRGAAFDARCDLNGNRKVDAPDARTMTTELLADAARPRIITVDMDGGGTVSNFPDTLRPAGRLLEFRVTGTFTGGELTHHSPIGCAKTSIPFSYVPGSPGYWRAQLTIPANVRTDGAPQVHLLTLDMTMPGGAIARAFDERAIRVLAAGSTAFDAETQAALDFWNSARTGVGVRPLTLNANAQNGHQWHAHYIVVNGIPNPGSPHEEDPTKPCYSSMGADYAGKSNISVYSARRSQLDATRGLLEAPMHRVRKLEPGLYATGMGWELASGAGTASTAADATKWECVFSEDVFSYKDSTGYTTPIRYPYHGQTGVSPSWKFAEAGLDTLFKGIAWYSIVGYPITIQWAFWSADITDVSGTLTRLGAGGGAVDVRAGNLQDISPGDRCIILLPTAPLAASTQYEAQIRCRRGGGAVETFTWRFTTGADVATSQATEPFILPAAPAPPKP